MKTYQQLMEAYQEDITGIKLVAEMDVVYESQAQQSVMGTFNKFKAIMEQYKEQTSLKERSEFNKLMKSVDEVGKNIEEMKELIETFNSLRG